MIFIDLLLIYLHANFSFLTSVYPFLLSSRDELRSATEWLLPSPAAGAHGRVPTHEDAQEDPGTSVICVLRDL